VLDADALNAFAGDADALAPLLDGRQALPRRIHYSRVSWA